MNELGVDTRIAGPRKKLVVYKILCKNILYIYSYINVFKIRSSGLLNLLKTKRNLLYTRNQSLPRSKHLPSLL